MHDLSDEGAWPRQVGVDKLFWSIFLTKLRENEKKNNLGKGRSLCPLNAPMDGK